MCELFLEKGRGGEWGRGVKYASNPDVNLFKIGRIRWKIRKDRLIELMSLVQANSFCNGRGTVWKFNGHFLRIFVLGFELGGNRKDESQPLLFVCRVNKFVWNVDGVESQKGKGEREKKRTNGIRKAIIFRAVIRSWVCRSKELIKRGKSWRCAGSGEESPRIR